MPYIQRLATLADTSEIAPLWQAFAQQRTNADSSMKLKSNFDFCKYVEAQLKKPRSYCFILEYLSSHTSDSKNIVGFLSTYVYDEAPPPELSTELESLENPFQPRRVGSVLGLYVQEKHRQPENIKLLIDAALAQAEDLKITDIDLLIGEEQRGIQALLKRAGFSKTAVQYTKHYQVTTTNLPSLHPPVPQPASLTDLSPKAIPFHDPKTQEIIHNPQGRPVFLEPLTDESGKVLKNSRGLPIYPIPVREPQSQAWLFDQQGKLVVRPVVRDEKGKVVENEQGIPQFYSPVYERLDGKLRLKCDQKGNYVFSKNNSQN